MRQLLHVLYVTEEDAELALSGRSLVVLSGGAEQRVPLHNLERIVSFSYRSASPKLMEFCANQQIGLSFVSKTGKLRYQIIGETKGSVLLRMQQYQLAQDKEVRITLAKAILSAKLMGSVRLLERFERNHPSITRGDMIAVENGLYRLEDNLSLATDEQELLGIEGVGAKQYFSVFDEMILQNRQTFNFSGRTRRPPLDPCNTLLSFAYTLLAADCKCALECVGLDPFVGFLHRERPGKPSLVLDLMEEFRPHLADRFVLRLINLKMLREEHFCQRDENGVCLTDNGRRIFLEEWSRFRHHETVLSEIGSRVPQGLIPHLQAQRMARFIRGDDVEYQPIGWR